MRIVLTANSSFALANFRAGLIRALRDRGHELVALVPPDAHADALRDAGCRLVPVRLNRRGTSPLEETRTLASVFSGLRGARPDMVFSYTIKNNIYGGLSAAALRIPFVPNVTGLGTLFSKDSALASSVSQLYRVAFRSAPVVFFQNEHDLERLTAARIVRPNQARLLPGSGVDLSHFSVAPLPGSHRAPTFLMVARLLREKGVAEFIAAARRVRQDVPGAIFKILGDYEAEGPAAVRKAEVEAWVAEKIVQYLGTVTDVRSVIASADCVVLPSYYPEGTPRVLLEAAAMGRPVVTTDTPGCRGTVEHGATGFIVAPRDAASLADAMLGVALAHPVRRAEMGLAGRSRMKVLYDEKIVVDAYLEIAERFGRRTNGRRT